MTENIRSHNGPSSATLHRAASNWNATSPTAAATPTKTAPPMRERSSATRSAAGINAVIQSSMARAVGALVRSNGRTAGP